MSSNTMDTMVNDHQATRLKIWRGLGVVTALLAAYEFFYRPLTAAGGTAEAVAFASGWPVFALYAAALAVAVFLGPPAVRRAIDDGVASPMFSVACVTTALSGLGISWMIGDSGVGEEIMVFYWAGLAAIWSASVCMVHICDRASKPAAVRDWTIYAYAMALIPLTLVPGIPLWPLFFELDAGQALMTAATSAFAAHLLVAHYVIFEIMERPPARP